MALPYWRLSAFYLFFFASLGAFIPYWSLYLSSVGFDPVAIGQLMAVVMATKIVAPNIWGWVADHTGQRMRIVRVACFFSMLAFVGVFVADGFWWLVLVMSVFSFFWNAALPQFEAETLTALGDEHHKYSQIRLWGSIGFVVAVVVLGFLLESWGNQLLPYVVVLLFLGLWLSTLTVPSRKVEVGHDEHGSILAVLTQPAVIILFIVCFLLQMSHGAYYTFYSVFLDENGYSRTVIGQLWGLGVLAEVGVFLVMHRLLPRFGALNLLMWSLALTTLRWLLIAGFVENAPVIVFAQLLHAASFGIYHAVSIYLIHKLFVGRHQGRGQALYSSLSFGAGGAIGSLVSGYVWSSFGGSFSFFVAAIASALAFALAWFGLKGKADLK